LRPGRACNRKQCRHKSDNGSTHSCHCHFLWTTS